MSEKMIPTPAKRRASKASVYMRARAPQVFEVRESPTEFFFGKPGPKPTPRGSMLRRLPHETIATLLLTQIAEQDRELSALRKDLQATKGEVQRLTELSRLERKTEVLPEMLAQFIFETPEDREPLPPELQSALAGAPGLPVPRQVDAEALAAQEWAALVGQGEGVRTGWVRTGLLVPSAELAEAWGRSRQALDQAAKRGEAFSIKVGKNRYYPAVFKSLDAETVKAVCSRLKGEDAVAKFVFWHKTHGGLRGLTPADAIRAGQGDKVAQLADAWSAERGLTD